MNNIWNKIKDNIFEKEIISESLINNAVITNSDEKVKLIIIEALGHYCPLCKRGFTHKGHKTNHDRIKHKV